MSLYNLLFGVNSNSDVLLAILGLKKSDVERFRDCGFEDGGIFIYTRTGGGNREDYPNEGLTSSPYYLGDEDDEYDKTYATYHFKFPDEIKNDCQKFKDVRKHGITAKLINWVVKTLERPETENDKWSRLWNEQNNLVQNSKQTHIHESNGHTITPLNESSLERYLELMEEAGGKQLSYSVMPYKLIISENVPRWNFDKNEPDLEKEMCRLKIDYGSKWEVDNDLWKRWKDKYQVKYPKSIKTIEESVERIIKIQNQ